MSGYSNSQKSPHRYGKSHAIWDHTVLPASSDFPAFSPADGHRNRSTKHRSGAQLVANLNFDFSQVVRQHSLGVVGYIIWVSFTIYYSSFQRCKKFENRLGFDKVITTSWVVHFLGHSVLYCRHKTIGYTLTI